MKIIDFVDNEELIKDASKLGNFFLDMFGEGNLGIVAILEDDNNIGFVGLKDGHACYVKNEENIFNHFEFGYNENYDINYLVSDNIVYALTDDGVICNDRDADIIKELRFAKMDNPDQDGFNYNIVFLQISNEKNTNLELRYQTNYYSNGELPYIYSYRLKDAKYVYLTDNNKKGIRSLPGLGNKYHYYIGCEMKNDAMDYDFAGENNERYTMRYSRMTHFVGDGYTDSVFSGKGISKNELNSLISSYGFDTEVPSRLLDMYNKEDKEFILANDIMKKIKEAVINEDNSKKATMVLEKKY